MQFSGSTFKSPWNIFSNCLTPKGSNPPYLSLKTAPFLSSREDGWRWDQTFNSLLLISRRHANIENIYQSYIPNMDTISMIMRRESWKAALGDILVGQTRLMKFGMAPHSTFLLYSLIKPISKCLDLWIGQEVWNWINVSARLMSQHWFNSFVTPLIFCYTTHFDLQVSLWAAITSKQQRVSHPNHIHFLNPECVRIQWVPAPKNFPLESFRVRSVSPKQITFLPISVSGWKKVLKRCAFNFDATDLPHSPFGPSYP